MNALISNLIKISMGLMLVIGTISCDEKNEPIPESIPESILESDIVYDTFSDNRDGKVYSYIQIGDQFWMAENLAYKYQTGYWVYDNKENNVDTYGYLYNWETACNVCPDGWHLASNTEYDSLINYLGGPTVAGGKMKRTGTYFWNSPNTGANNSSGFTAIPGGSRNRVSWFDSMGEFGCFWTSSEQGEYYAWFLSLRYDSESAGSILGINGLDWCDRNYGRSVRCIKDY